MRQISLSVPSHSCQILILPLQFRYFISVSVAGRHQIIANRDYSRRYSKQQFTSKKQHGKCQQKFQCGVCEKYFGWKSNLTTHIRIHSGDKPYSCDICGRSFSENRNLKRHQLTHTKKHRGKCQQNFQCGVCEKYFGWKSHLTTHIRIHSGDKPYSCDICGRSFNENRNLKRHQLTHTEEKTFKC